MALRSLRAARSFLHSLEFIEELGPSNVVTTLAAGTGGAVEGRCSLGRAIGTHEYVRSVLGRTASCLGIGIEDSICIPAGTTMEETDVADAVQPIFKGGKGGALGEEHEDTVEAFIQVGVFFGFEELQTKV